MSLPFSRREILELRPRRRVSRSSLTDFNSKDNSASWSPCFWFSFFNATTVLRSWTTLGPFRTFSSSLSYYPPGHVMGGGVRCLFPLLGADTMDSASPFSLGESAGKRPLPYPPLGVRTPKTLKRFGVLSLMGVREVV